MAGLASVLVAGSVAWGQTSPGESKWPDSNIYSYTAPDAALIQAALNTVPATPVPEIAPPPVSAADPAKEPVADLMGLYQLLYCLGHYTEAESVASKMLELSPDDVVGKVMLDLASRKVRQQKSARAASCGQDCVESCRSGHVAQATALGVLLGGLPGALAGGLQAAIESQSGCCAAAGCCCEGPCPCGTCACPKAACGGACQLGVGVNTESGLVGNICQPAHGCMPPHGCMQAPCCPLGCTGACCQPHGPGCCMGGTGVPGMGVHATFLGLMPMQMIEQPGCCMPPGGGPLMALMMPPGTPPATPPMPTGFCPPPMPSMPMMPPAARLCDGLHGYCVPGMPCCNAPMPNTAPQHASKPKAAKARLAKMDKLECGAPVCITANNGRILIQTPRMTVECDRVQAMGAGDKILVEGDARVDFHGDELPATIIARRILLGLHDGSFQINPATHQTVSSPTAPSVNP
jgi:hypothetical protein